jgi:diguanylate cyclase (GGDEF)-like protein
MCLDTTGKIYLARNDYAQAEDFLKQAKALCLQIGRHTDETSLSLAHAAIEQGRLEEAKHLLCQSLKSVEARGVSRYSFQFHELLVRIYEEQRDFQKALEHYKRFHTIKSQVFNDETQRRLGNLIVLHQAETTHIDAEIYRLKNLALRREISEHRKATAEMEIMATTDTLTGLLNRRHIMTLAGYSFETARQAGKALVVLMMDIDHFKKVNDRYGHLAGDQALAEVSATIHACLRTGDLLGRYGGEEFVAVLPDTGLYGAQHVAERILKNVANHVTRFRSQDIRLTLSIGVAQAGRADTSFENLLERADYALHAAKRAGKNQVVVDWANNRVLKS